MIEVVDMLLWIIDHAPKSESKSVRDRLDIVRLAIKDLGKTVRDVEASNR